MAPVDLKALAQSALRLCAAANAEAGIAVETELADAPPIQGDREQLTQVFLNLLSNAREAMPQGGTIRVALRPDGQELAVAVSDTGVGLSEEARAKIFTPYFTTKEKGTGLGLAIVHRIILVHGGRIDVDSAPGVGTTFSVRFPIKAA
jgi:signal transduction histidine kinase